MAVSIQFIFNGEVISFPAHGAAFTTNICKQIFESLNNIGEVRCTRTAGVDAYGGHVTTVHFHHFPIHPYESNLYTNDGVSLLNRMICKTDYVTGVSNTATCRMTDTVPAQAPEYAYCSIAVSATLIPVFASATPTSQMSIVILTSMGLEPLRLS